MNYLIWVARKDETQLVRLKSKTEAESVRAFQTVAKVAGWLSLKDVALVDEDGVVVRELLP